ncbi:hypothetical protein LCGC14_3146320 [marine sediment metagenome]|uniref:Uncharacterized protein n=1 Tax=marine sediment metagenome TaxID=412755 RepID=A0A0F8WJD7_9ZZZZ
MTTKQATPNELEKPKSTPEYDRGWNDAIEKYKEVWLPKEVKQAKAAERSRIRDANDGYLCDVCNKTDHKWCGTPHKMVDPLAKQGVAKDEK